MNLADALKHVTEVAERVVRNARFAAAVEHLEMEDYRFVSGEVCKLFAEYHLQQINIEQLDGYLHSLEQRLDLTVEQNLHFYSGCFHSHHALDVKN